MDDSTAVPSSALSLTVDDADMVRLRWAPGLRIDEPTAREAMRAVDDLNGERVRPLYVDIAGAATITREARLVFTERCSASRVALVGRSPVDHVMATFTVRVSVPPVPTRFFTSESEAVAWLREEPSSAPGAAGPG